MQVFANNAYSSLGASLSNSATSLTLATATGIRFPSPTGGSYFLLTLVGLDSNGNENAWEIVKVTGRASDALTIVRAQESTTAVAWAAGTRVELRATAGTFSSYATLAAPTFTGGITVSSGGASITGDTSVTGTLGVSSTLSTTSGSAVRLYRPDNTTYTDISMAAGASGGLIFNNANGDGFTFKNTGSTVAQFSSTGLSVTGQTKTTTYFSANDQGYIRGDRAGYLQFQGGTSGFIWSNNGNSTDQMVLDASGNLNMTAGGHIGRTATASGIFFNTNSILPSTGTGATDNTVSFGGASYRWTTIYATTGAINTSDARAKTKVRTLADAEIEAAIEHSKEIGIFQWLDAVAKKGEKARQHIGMTVQRSIEIMESHGLDPMSYAFICYDVWADEFKEHPAIDAVEAKAAVLDDEGNEVEPAIEAVEGKDAWTEQTQTAGDRYAFRYDQLNLFIARGIEARLAALEAA